ncbi:MAG: NUDIX domain-containing protein [Romboutsia sp.]|nr:NUDIX domain-containing protein [Romboutsia sp.]
MCDTELKKSQKSTSKKWFSEPITSYGLVLYTISNKEILFLLYQRRDSFEYMDFLRGVWRNVGQLPALFSSMTTKERKRIREYTFDELWDDLWIEHNSKIYIDGYSRGKRKYDSIKDKIPNLLDTTKSHIEEPPWGFPKGKKNSQYEKDLDCALREFQEETRLIRGLINIENYTPISENFKGSNGKAYATHYYIASTKNPIYPEKIQTPNGIRKDAVSEEASDIKWYTYNEAIELLNPQRRSLLKEVYDTIKL